MVKEGLINLDFADVRSVMREMGKAMMGTGEASGERRAIQAAEAAIANPLLDETSMKGAKGLLISITGGKDLTLFEVDEAATRIREEVDPDANIILGATFEESLEGVIRVSVVATGIEKEAAQASDPQQAAAIQAAAARLAEIRTEHPAVAPVIAAQTRPRPVAQPTATPIRPAADSPAAPVRPAPQPMAAKPAPVEPAAEPDYSSALAAAMDQQPEQDPGVTITAYSAAPSAAHYDEHGLDMEMTAAPAEEEAEVEMEAPFIPPQPEAPPSRMPKIEDFPAVAQRQVEARRAPAEQEDRGPLSLLRRLAGVGLGRREEDPVIASGKPQQPQARPQPAQAQRPQPRVQMPPPPPAPDYTKRPPQPRVASEGLYKPRQGELDPHGRQVPREQRGADDELEIPAFLRRQAN
jgi:cell division protein FtsZ